MIHDNEDEIHTRSINQYDDPIPELTPLEQERRDKVWAEWDRKKAKTKRKGVELSQQEKERKLCES